MKSSSHLICFLVIASFIYSTYCVETQSLDTKEGTTEENSPKKNELDVSKYFYLKDIIEQYITTKGFFTAFLSSISMIIVSELGDKTFFIAVIMASRHSRVVVFLGAISALALMTLFSALIGSITKKIPQLYVYYASTILFAVFGIRMLYEAYQMSAEEGQEEFEEAHRTVIRRESEFEKENGTEHDVEAGAYKALPAPVSRFRLIRRRLRLFFSRTFLEAFTATYLAEWGDRSQVTTIFLAAKENTIGVTLGATIGHCVCTLLAVLGGRVIAQKISVRTVTFIGGVIFLIFAISALISGPEEVPDIPV